MCCNIAKFRKIKTKTTEFQHFSMLKFLDGHSLYKPCPFESGLRKFALDPVVVIFFKDAKCWFDPVVRKIWLDPIL